MSDYQEDDPGSLYRLTDPDTSKDAAEAVDIQRDRMIALDIYKGFWPEFVTDGHIAQYVERHMPDRIPESIRRRCTDLRSGKGFGGVPQVEGDPLLDASGDVVLKWGRPKLRKMKNPNGSDAYAYRWIKRD